MLKLNGPTKSYNSLHTCHMFHPYALIILGKVYASILPEGHYMLPVKSFTDSKETPQEKSKNVLPNQYAVVLLSEL